MDDLQFHAFFTSISNLVIRGRLAGDNERLSAMKFSLQLKRLAASDQEPVTQQAST